MSVFKEVSFSWDGREYVLPSTEILLTIAKVEDVLTLGDLHRARVSGRLPFAKLAIAYGIALRAAGANLSDEQVYNGLFGNAGGELVGRALTALVLLQALMVPPEHLRAAPGKVDGGEGVGASSPSATSSSSGTAG